MICAWIDAGELALKKSGLASFWSPAKRKVTPKKARRGSSDHSANAHARAGAPKGRCDAATRRRTGRLFAIGGVSHRDWPDRLFY
jgi:hypothetical protein